MAIERPMALLIICPAMSTAVNTDRAMLPSTMPKTTSRITIWAICPSGGAMFTTGVSTSATAAASPALNRMGAILLPRKGRKLITIPARSRTKRNVGM